MNTKKTIELKNKLFKAIMYILEAFLPPALTARVTARKLILNIQPSGTIRN